VKGRADVRGSQITQPVTHGNLRRTLEDRWGLMRVGHSADAGIGPLPVPLPGTDTGALMRANPPHASVVIAEELPSRTVDAVNAWNGALADKWLLRTGRLVSSSHRALA